VIGAHIFILTIFQFLSPKLKKRRVFRKKKSRKKERKIGRTSFKFFQLLLSFSLHKKEFKGEGKQKKSFPNSPPSPSFPFPKHEKKSENPLENGRKETKRKKKEEKKKGSLILISCSHSP
jgi:hypothetical protein